MAVTLSVNGRREQAEAGQTLAAVLEGIKVRPEVSVVFLNRTRVEQARVSEITASDGDTIEVIIQLAGGSHA